MIDRKRTQMLAIRIPGELRERLERVADREMRSVSRVAERAIEVGLDALEARGFSGGESALRGAEFEQAVTAILVSYGLLAELPPEMAKMPSKKLGVGRPTKHRKAG